MKKLDGEGIVLTADEIDALLEGWTFSSYELGSLAWQKERAKVGLRMGWKYLKNRGKRLLKAPASFMTVRTKEFVQQQYEPFWAEDQIPAPVPKGKRHKAFMPIEWNGKGYLASRFSKARLSNEIIYRMIKATGAKTVLEVGCGNGLHLLEVADRLKDVKLTGVDLTQAGITAAQAQQKTVALDPRIVHHMPGPVVNPGNFRKIAFLQADATAMPFADDSFDLVYTHTALEQMNSVAPAVLREIRRVGRKDFLFIEPFAESQVDALRKLAIAAKDHWRLPAARLAEYGLKPDLVWFNWPLKLVGGTCVVTARKDVLA
jgi:SAM-dependent methyltransferase